MCVAIQLFKIYILYIFTFKFNLHSHDNVDNQFLFMILLWIHGIGQILQFSLWAAVRESSSLEPAGLMYHIECTFHY